MVTTKPRASDDRILYLIQKRRRAARDAMGQIIQGFLRFPVNVPSATYLLDYLSHMVFCLELMLKLLSGDWGSHKVGVM